MATTLMTIAEAAARATVTPGTLREYHKLGLIHPQRDSSGRRLFSERDVETARRIAAERRARWNGAAHNVKAKATA